MSVLEFRIFSLYSVSYLDVLFKFPGFLKILLPLVLIRKNPNSIGIVFSPLLVASFFQRTLPAFFHIKIIIIMCICLLFRIAFLKALPYGQFTGSADHIRCILVIDESVVFVPETIYRRT